MTGSQAFRYSYVRRSILLLLLLALVAVAGISVFSGPAVAEDEWSRVSIIYQGDVGGHIEPCG